MRFSQNPPRTGICARHGAQRSVRRGAHRPVCALLALLLLLLSFTLPSCGKNPDPDGTEAPPNVSSEAGTSGSSLDLPSKDGPDRESKRPRLPRSGKDPRRASRLHARRRTDHRGGQPLRRNPRRAYPPRFILRRCQRRHPGALRRGDVFSVLRRRGAVFKDPGCRCGNGRRGELFRRSSGDPPFLPAGISCRRSAHAPLRAAGIFLSRSR